VYDGEGNIREFTQPDEEEKNIGGLRQMPRTDPSWTIRRREVIKTDTGEPCAVKVARTVRRGMVGEVPGYEGLNGLQ